MLSKKRIVIDGAPREFEFGMAMFMLYEQTTGRSYGQWISEVIDVLASAEGVEAGTHSVKDIKMMPIIDVAYYALWASAELAGESFEIRKIQIAAWLNDFEVMKAVAQGFIQSIPQPSADNQTQQPDEAKKKKVKALPMTK